MQHTDLPNPPPPLLTVTGEGLTLYETDSLVCNLRGFKDKISVKLLINRPCAR